MTDTNLPGQMIAGRYRIVRPLGEGGQGQVFVAVQEALGRDIALKVIRGELAGDPSMVERFQREARTVSELQHPHIVTIYDFGVSDGTMFMAMELLQGQSLRERFESGVPLSHASAIAVVRDICSALSAAHKRGVVHRDLKPDNVMLVEGAGRADFVKVLDFGIAKKMNSGQTNVTQQGMIVGTPGYLAPEVATGGTLDAKADLYALGVIWYEMVANKPLFDAPTPMALVMKHAIEPPAPLRSLGIDVPPDVDALITQLLEKNPANRPESADAIVARLDRAGFGTNSSGISSGIQQVQPAQPAPMAAQPARMATQQLGSMSTSPASVASSSLSSSYGPPTSSTSPMDPPMVPPASAPPAPPVKKSGFGLAGCLKIGCVIFVVGGLALVAVGIWGGNWINHFYTQTQRPIPVRPAPAPAPAPAPVPVPRPHR